MDEWSWLLTVEPESVERERFNVDARTVKRTEGTHLGFKTVKVSREERARVRLIEKERDRVIARGHAWSKVRSLEAALVRERRARAREVSWHKKLLEIKGRDIPGPQSLKGTA